MQRARHGKRLQADEVREDQPQRRSGSRRQPRPAARRAHRNREAGGRCGKPQSEGRCDADGTIGGRHAPLVGADRQEMRGPDACPGAATGQDQPERTQLALLLLRERVRLHRGERAAAAISAANRTTRQIEPIQTNVCTRYTGAPGYTVTRVARVVQGTVNIESMKSNNLIAITTNS